MNDLRERIVRLWYILWDRKFKIIKKWIKDYIDG
jgi:hypothetical protein